MASATNFGLSFSSLNLSKRSMNNFDVSFDTGGASVGEVNEFRAFRSFHTFHWMVATFNPGGFPK